MPPFPFSSIAVPSLPLPSLFALPWPYCLPLSFHARTSTENRRRKSAFWKPWKGHKPSTTNSIKWFLGSGKEFNDISLQTIRQQIQLIPNSYHRHHENTQHVQNDRQHITYNTTQHKTSRKRQMQRQTTMIRTHKISTAGTVEQQEEQSARYITNSNPECPKTHDRRNSHLIDTDVV